MSNTVLESFFLIRYLSTNTYLRFTTQNREQLALEVEMEDRGSFYSDGILSATYHQAHRFFDLKKAEEVFLMLDSIKPAGFEIIEVTVHANKAS